MLGGGGRCGNTGRGVCRCADVAAVIAPAPGAAAAAPGVVAPGIAARGASGVGAGPQLETRTMPSTSEDEETKKRRSAMFEPFGYTEVELSLRER